MAVVRKGAKPRWVSERDIGHGMLEVRLKKVDYLVDCFEKRYVLTLGDCIFRGQRKHVWPIDSSFDRVHKFKTPSVRGAALQRHLNRFRRSLAGRRGANPPQYTDNGDWWALRSGAIAAVDSILYP